MRIHLEPLSREHLEFIRCLRNSLRKHFFDTNPITQLQQKTWYWSYLDGHSLLIWVIISRGKPVGTISRRYLGHTPANSHQIGLATFEIGNLMLLPSYQGKGIMLEAMRQLTALGSECFYVAHVKPHNTASLNLFKRAGFWRVPRAR